MASLNDQIKNFFRAMLPTGAAFNFPEGGTMDKLFSALSNRLNIVNSDVRRISSHILADNDDFTIEDAELWEKRLGITITSGTTLADRKLAIIRKYRHPGSQLPRQSASFIQQELQDAGFNVFVYENIPQLAFEGTNPIRLGQARLGQSVLGKKPFAERVIHSLNNDDDLLFLEGQNYKQSFSIGGSTLGTFADVDMNREKEFRELILKLKPLHTIAQLRINYV